MPTWSVALTKQLPTVVGGFADCMYTPGTPTIKDIQVGDHITGREGGGGVIAIWCPQPSPNIVAGPGRHF